MSDRDNTPVVVVEKGGLGYFLTGLLAGAGLALLFAPRSGEETRRELRERGRKLRDAAEDSWDDLQTSVGSSYERTRGRIEEGLDTAKKTYHDTKEAGSAAVHSAREELERRLTEARASRKGEEDEEAVEAGAEAKEE